MPRRDDIKKILVIGSGPIVIGQACEFDYSGAQACKVLREDGYEVVLVNSNPGDDHDRSRSLRRAPTSSRSRPSSSRRSSSARSPTRCCRPSADRPDSTVRSRCAEQAILERHGVELIGAQARRHQEGRGPQALPRGDGAHRSRRARERLRVLASEDAEELAEELGFPLVCRPSFTMGGAGGGIAYNIEELREIVSGGLALSPVGEVLVEESVIGWKEFEMEVMRDRNDNAVIVCSIENFDRDGRAHRRLRSPSRRHRRSPIASTRSCATPRSPSCARSASRPAAPTSSSPSIRTTGASSSSR